LPEASCSTLEGTVSHLHEEKSYTLRSPVIGSGTIMRKDKVSQLEDNKHKLEEGKPRENQDPGGGNIDLSSRRVANGI
jgi:hypothetical protein